MRLSRMVCIFFLVPDPYCLGKAHIGCGTSLALLRLALVLGFVSNFHAGWTGVDKNVQTRVWAV